MRLLLIVTTMAVLGLPACAPQPADIEQKAAVPILEPEPFAAQMARDDSFVLNVHTPDEGSIPGTDAAIAFDELEARRSELPNDLDASLVIYCMSGNMSVDAAETLTDMGYTDIVDLRGGMKAWRDAGRPLLPADSAVGG